MQYGKKGRHMRLALRHGVTLGTFASLLLAGSVSAAVQHGSAGQSTAAAGANVDWPRFGNTTDNTRFSSLAQINTSNVSQLGLAWTQPEGRDMSTFETMPVV